MSTKYGGGLKLTIDKFTKISEVFSVYCRPDNIDKTYSIMIRSMSPYSSIIQI